MKAIYHRFCEGVNQIQQSVAVSEANKSEPHQNRDITRKRVMSGGPISAAWRLRK